MDHSPNLLGLPNELILYILRQFLDLGDVWRLLQVSRQLRQFAIDTIHKRWKIELVFTPETAMKIQCRAALIALEDVSCQLSLHTRRNGAAVTFDGSFNGLPTISRLSPPFLPMHNSAALDSANNNNMDSDIDEQIEPLQRRGYLFAPESPATPLISAADPTTIGYGASTTSSTPSDDMDLDLEEEEEEEEGDGDNDDDDDEDEDDEDDDDEDDETIQRIQRSYSPAIMVGSITTNHSNQSTTTLRAPPPSTASASLESSEAPSNSTIPPQATTNTPRFNGTDFLLATTDCDNKLVHDLMLKEERLHQRIIRGISSYKHKYVLIEDIDIRNRIRATVDVIFHHAVFVSALSRPHLVCPNSNNRSLAAMMVRLLTRLDAAFPSYCREITYTLADHIKAFLEYTGYKLLAQRPTCDPFGPQQAPLLVSTLHTIAACFDLMGAAFVGKILGETHVECAVQRTCELLSDDRHLLGLVKKALLVDLLENWLTNKRGLVAGELCRMVRSEIEACSRQQLLLVQQQQQGGRVSSFFMEQDHSRYQQRQDQDSFLYRPSSLHTRYQLS